MGWDNMDEHGTAVISGETAELLSDPREILEFVKYRNGLTFDDVASPAATSDMLDEALVADFVAKAKERRPRLARRSDDEVLDLTGARRRGVPTLAGMMTLSNYPQQVYPNLCVTAVAVPGTTMEQGRTDMRFIDNVRIEGPIPQMIEDVVEFVQRNSTNRPVMEKGKKGERPEYPGAAVRELVTNAFMHRDYGPGSSGTPVRVTLFSDRLECWNPGGVFGGHASDDLAFDNVQTKNPTLVSLLETLGIAENRHSGMAVVRNEMRTAGLKPPVFLDEDGYFTAVLHNGSRPEAPLGSAGGWRVTDAKVLDFCRFPRTRQEVASHFGSSVAYVTREYLNPLVKRGELKLTLPDKRCSKYQRFVVADREG